MASDMDYAREGVPTDLLGLHRATWTKDTLLVVLNHYGVSSDKSVSKLNLMRRLDQLVRDRDLHRFDRREILGAYTRGDPLPPRKPKISAVTSGSTVKKTSSIEKTPSDKKLASFKKVPSVEKAPSVKKLTSVKKVPSVKKVASFKEVASIRKVPSFQKISGIDCIVCFETLEPTVFPKRTTTAACSHKPDVCLQCLSSSITTQSRDKMWDQIGCPSCGERLGYTDVQAFADSVVFERQELTFERMFDIQLTYGIQVRQPLTRSLPNRLPLPALSPSRLPVRSGVLSR